jgi:predicted amidohydrolase YtcJ
MAARLTAYIVCAIVALTLIAGLIVGAQRDDNSVPVDLIVYNARVYTASEDEPWAEAVAVRGNQILRVGSNREIKRLRRPQTRFVDAQGGAVLPGFNDAHLNLSRSTLGTADVDLPAAGTFLEIRDSPADTARRQGEPWTRRRGWHDLFSSSDFTLQPSSRKRPTQMIPEDGYVAWLSAHAVDFAGDRAGSIAPADLFAPAKRTRTPGRTPREPARRQPISQVSQMTRDERLRAMRSAIGEAHRHGITSIHDLGTGLDDLDLYDQLRRQGDLKVRVYSAVALADRFTEADTSRLDAVRKRYADDPLFKAEAVTLMADEPLDASSGVVSSSRQSAGGRLRYSQDQLNHLVSRLEARGWQICIRASGDEAVRMALDAFEHAADQDPQPARARRHRIEHAETIAEDDVHRFAELGVIVSVQPGRRVATAADSRTRRIGSESGFEVWQWGAVKASGGRVIFGSRWPSGNMDPRLAMVRAMAPRSVAASRAAPASMPFQDLRLTQIIDAYTREAAYASFDEQRKGVLAPGMLADLVVLSQDIFAQPAGQLLEAVVDVTIFDGEIVYTRDRAAGTD